MKKKRARKIREFASKKQVNAISFIEEMLEIKFKGNTQKEVSEFIGNYLEKAQFLNKLDNEMRSIMKKDNNRPISVKTAHVTIGGPEGLDDSWSLNDSLAMDIFKGDIMRGKDPRESLLKLQRQVGLMRLAGAGDIREDMDDYYEQFSSYEDYEDYMELD